MQRHAHRETKHLGQMRKGHCVLVEWPRDTAAEMVLEELDDATGKANAPVFPRDGYEHQTLACAVVGRHILVQLLLLHERIDQVWAITPIGGGRDRRSEDQMCLLVLVAALSMLSIR